MMKQLTRWSCLAACFAHVLNMTEKSLYSELGHDGSEVWWEKRPFPLNRRGFHPQELLAVAWNHRKMVVPFENRPCFEVDEHIKAIPNWPFLNILMTRSGVLTGLFRGNPHAAIWDHEKKIVLDPNGTEYPLHGQPISIEFLYAVDEL